MKQTAVTEYIIAGVIGFLIGLRLLGNALGIIYIVIGIACIYFAFRYDLRKVFTLLPYLIFTEIFVRRGGGVTIVPYLFMPYVLMTVFFVLVLKQGGTLKMHSKCTLFIFFYAIMEILDLVRAQDITYSRSMITNTMVLLAVSLWSCGNFLTPRFIELIIRHLKIGAVFLCGNILVAHFTHDITYMDSSSSEASNWMSAVQLSGYLGLGSILFFLAIMDQRQKSQLFLNVMMFALVTTLMTLTFSRGGLYFLSAIIILYMLFNRKQIGKFLILFLLLPVGYLIFYYVTKTTNGLIEKRYSAEGSSGRDELVRAGFKLFEQEPLAGVGTGNYVEEIANRDLFNGESGAHNEFVRAAAEHGILGIITYWGFYIVIFIEIIKRKKEQRDLAIYFLVLFCLITVHNGLKISVQPFLLILIIASPTLIRVPKRKNVQTIPNLTTSS